MSFALAPGISFCEAGGHRIFLDLRADRYFCLGTLADAAFSALSAGAALTSEDHVRLETLRRRKILVAAESVDRPKACQIRPICSAPLDHEGPKAGMATVLRAALSVARAKSDLRRRPLDQVCVGLAADKARSAKRWRSPDPEELRRLAFAFQASGRIVGALDQCLALSLGIARASLRRRIAIDLLFGVRLRPFQAHAWVLADGALLSDHSDVVRQFTPILVI